MSANSQTLCQPSCVVRKRKKNCLKNYVKDMQLLKTESVGFRMAYKCLIGNFLLLLSTNRKV